MGLKLSAYFDESGKFKDHDIVAFCGLVSPPEDWYALQVEWDSLLHRNGITHLHMSGGTLNFRLSLSAKRPALGKKERIAVIRQFVLAIKRHIELGIAIAVDVQGYKSLPPNFKSEIGGEDPYYWVFSCAMAAVLDHLNGIPGSKVNIVCDDEEQYFVQCYKLLNKFKLREPVLKNKFVAICAGDDREFPQLQAADLLAYLTRTEAGYLFFDKPYDFRELSQEFSTHHPGEKMVFSPHGVMWKRERLYDYVENQLAKRRKPKKS